MHLVDTSVWIHALRPAGDPAIRERLKPLILKGETAITEWIILELMTGLSSSERKQSLLQRFAPVIRLPFETQWWEDAWENAASLRKRGISPTAADCFIATISLKHNVPLVHCDGDFENMKEVLGLETMDWRTHLVK